MKQRKGRLGPCLSSVRVVVDRLAVADGAELRWKRRLST